MYKKRPKPPGAQFRKRRKEEDKWAVDKGMQMFCPYNYACHENRAKLN